MWFDLIPVALFFKLLYLHDFLIQTGNFFSYHSPVAGRYGRGNSTGQIGAGEAGQDRVGGQGKDSVLQDGAGRPSLIATLKLLVIILPILPLFY